MDLFRFLFNIFTSMQEGDIKRRQQAAAKRKKQGKSQHMTLEEWLDSLDAAEGKQAPSQASTPPQERTRTRTTSPTMANEPVSLEDWLDTMLDQPAQAVPQAQQRKEPARPKKKKKKKVQQVAPKVEVKPQPSISDEGLLDKSKNVATLLHQDAYDVDHHDAYSLTEQKQGFKLPGKTPLQQLMWAQVVMGPCKAHQSRRTIG